MGLKFSIPGILLILVFFSACHKDEESDAGNYIRLKGQYKAICSNSKNEILISGFIHTDLDSGMIILKTDMNGNQIWEKRYHFNYTTVPVKILAAENDEFYIAADRIIGANNLTYGYENVLLKCNDNGDTLFQTLLEEMDDFWVSNMIFSRNGGVLVLLMHSYNHRDAILIDISSSGQILSRTELTLSNDQTQIGEFPSGDRYLMNVNSSQIGSLSVAILQLDLSGEIIDTLFMVRENQNGMAFFAEEEQKVFWLSAEGQNIIITKTNLSNQADWMKEQPIPDYLLIGIERMEQIGDMNYALGHCGKDINTYYGICILKFNGAGDMESKHFTQLKSMPSYLIHFAGLKNGSLALIYPMDDAQEEGGNYALRIYQ